MTLFYMTPEQVANRLIAERLKLSDNAKELCQKVIDRKAEARKKIENLKIASDAARGDGNV